MPRAQKHPAHLRHSLEKLRLDVALKRARLLQAQRLARKPVPYSERIPPTDERIEAVKAKTLKVEKDLRLVKSQGYLNYIKKSLKDEMETQGIQLLDPSKD